MKEINECRICGNPNLVPILDLGAQALTGVFPRNREEKVTVAPLQLVKCKEDGDSCGLVQLKHSVDTTEMYGDNYGYRSGLNQSMINHLRQIVDKILVKVPLKKGDMILDIGSNDGTQLAMYPKDKDPFLVGIDPTIKKFKKYYKDDIIAIPNFFSSIILKEKFLDRKAKIITAIAMFYDLEQPIEFMKEIKEVLADDGVFVIEQSYMPTMLDMTAYDTVCHEHLEYYRMKQIKWMADRTGFKIIDVEFNDVNGGSFLVMMAHEHSQYEEASPKIKEILKNEDEFRLSTITPYIHFRDRVIHHKERLLELIDGINERGKVMLGYGASTKGNVILQYCGLTRKDVPYIGEVNENKYNCVTPGTFIPIVSEKLVRRLKPPFLLVLPWHFKDFIIEKEKEYLQAGGKIIFPLPAPHIVDRNELGRLLGKKAK